MAEEMSNAALRPAVALISGHTDLTPTEFQQHYIPQINKALQDGHHFIFGDAVGADTMALEYLLAPSTVSQYPDTKCRLTVYPSRRYNIPKLQNLGLAVVPPDHRSLHVERTVVVVDKTGRDARRYHHIQRDANMTAASDYDILYVRSEEESRKLYGEKYRARVSATEMNRRRREELGRPGGKEG